MSQVNRVNNTEIEPITGAIGKLRQAELREGIDYARGTPQTFIPGGTPITWESMYELSHEALSGAKDNVELRLASVLYKVIGNRMGNPWAGDTSRIVRQARARIALLARTKSKQRDVVVAMLRAGYGVGEIASFTRLHTSTVRKWHRRMKLSDYP